MFRDDARRSGSPIAPRLLLLAAGVLVAFVVGEIGARWLLPAPQVVRIASAADAERRAAESAEPSSVRVPRHPEQAAGSLYVDTPRGRRLRADARVVIDNHALSQQRIEIRTNAQGYRNRPLGPKAGRRILFLGDSITFGDYVPEAMTFVRRVEQLARANGRDWETINAGVGGVGLDEQIAILHETGLDSDPDVVVLDFYLNDFEASPGVRVVELPGPLARSALLHHTAHAVAAGWASLRLALGGRPADEIDWEAWADALEASWSTSGPESDEMRRRALGRIYDWGGAFSPLAWERLRPRLRELASAADARGIQLVVVGFPVRDQVVAQGVYAAPQHALAAELDALGVPLLDLLPLLRAAHRRERRPLFYDHCHPTPLGNAFVAEAVYRFLVLHEARQRPGEAPSASRSTGAP